jgi:cystathionine beta-lyase/cystathionine gamma-synthase
LYLPTGSQNPPSPYVLYVVVDNTWLTEVVFNPFALDVDFVVMSLTKYYSGGNAIAGAVVSNNENVIDKIIESNICNGFHISPYTCKVINANIKNMSYHKWHK